MGNYTETLINISDDNIEEGTVKTITNEDGTFTNYIYKNKEWVIDKPVNTTGQNFNQFQYNGPDMEKLAEALNGGPNYKPMFESIINTIESVNSDVQNNKERLDKHDEAFKALACGFKVISFFIAVLILSIIIYIIYIILTHK